MSRNMSLDNIRHNNVIMMSWLTMMRGQRSSSPLTLWDHVTCKDHPHVVGVEACLVGRQSLQLSALYDPRQRDFSGQSLDIPLGVRACRRRSRTRWCWTEWNSTRRESTAPFRGVRSRDLARSVVVIGRTWPSRATSRCCCHRDPINWRPTIDEPILACSPFFDNKPSSAFNRLHGQSVSRSVVVYWTHTHTLSRALKSFCMLFDECPNCRFSYSYELSEYALRTLFSWGQLLSLSAD